MARSGFVMVGRWYHVLFLSSAGFCAGCALVEGGTGAGVAPGEGGVDAPAESAAQQCTMVGTACVGGLVTGWTPIVSIPASASCPANFVQKDVVKNPTPMDGACTCGCTTTRQPSCSKGNTFDVKWGATGCTFDWNFNFNDGACGATGFQNVGTKNALPPPTLTDGACTADMAKADPQKVMRTVARVCEPPMECREDVCAGKVPAGSISCIRHLDDVACPNGPFSQKLGVFGDDVTLGCSPCSTCKVTAKCGAGTLRYFSDAMCTTQTATVAMDNQCNDTNATGAATYYKYDAPVMNIACAASGSVATPGLSGKQTVCCRP